MSLLLEGMREHAEVALCLQYGLLLMRDLAQGSSAAAVELLEAGAVEVAVAALHWYSLHGANCDSVDVSDGQNTFEQHTLKSH